MASGWTADVPDDGFAAVRLECGHARLIRRTLVLPVQSRPLTGCEPCGIARAAVRFLEVPRA